MSVPPSQYSIVITNYGVPQLLQQETMITRSQIIWCGNDGVLRAKSIFHPKSPIDLKNIDPMRTPVEVVKGIGVSWSSMAQPAHGDCIAPNSLGINATGEMRFFSKCQKLGIFFLIYLTVYSGKHYVVKEWCGGGGVEDGNGEGCGFGGLII